MTRLSDGAMQEEETRRRNAAAAASTDEGLAALEIALRDSSWRVRKAAAGRIAEAFPAARVVPRLTRLLVDATDAGARAAAAEALSLLGAGAVPSLAAAFGAGDERMRKSVLDVIAAAGLGSGADLARAGLSDADPNVRVAAVEALGRLRPEDAGSLLARAIGDPELLVRFAALECLPALSPGVPVAAVLAAADEPHLRRAAIRALGRLAAVEAVPLLSQVLADPAQPAWVEALLAAVAVAERRPSAEGALSAAPVAELRARLASEDSRTAGAAAIALSLIGDAASAPALARLASRLPDAGPAARAALSRLGAAGLEALASQVAEFPFAAMVQAAAAFEDGPEAPEESVRVIAALRALLGACARDPARAGGARLALAAALARRGEADDVSLLVDRVVTEPGSEQGHAAADALRMFASAGGADALAARLDPFPPAGSAARGVLASLLGGAGSAAIPALRRLIRDADAGVRRHALAALGAADGDLGFEEATAALSDEDSSVRTAAVTTLAALASGRDARAVEVVVRAVRDRDLLVRVSAVRALGAIGTPAAISAILAIAHGGSPLLDLAIIEALRPVSRDAGARERLLEYAASNNPDVSALAHEALVQA